MVFYVNEGLTSQTRGLNEIEQTTSLWETSLLACNVYPRFSSPEDCLRWAWHKCFFFFFTSKAIRFCAILGETVSIGFILFSVVFLSNWTSFPCQPLFRYGGVHLGPDRFKHINNCARTILVDCGFVPEKVSPVQWMLLLVFFTSCFLATIASIGFAWKRSSGLISCFHAKLILVIFGRSFFRLKALGKKWKMMPLWCACAVVITLETQKCRKRAPRSVEFNFFIYCDRHKRFSQNERRRADLQNVASDFFNFCLGTQLWSFKVKWWFYPVFSTLKDHN